MTIFFFGASVTTGATGLTAEALSLCTDGVCLTCSRFFCRSHAIRSGFDTLPLLADGGRANGCFPFRAYAFLGICLLFLWDFVVGFIHNTSRGIMVTWPWHISTGMGRLFSDRNLIRVAPRISSHRRRFLVPCRRDLPYRPQRDFFINRHAFRGRLLRFVALSLRFFFGKIHTIVPYNAAARIGIKLREYSRCLLEGLRWQAGFSQRGPSDRTVPVLVADIL